MADGDSMWGEGPALPPRPPSPPPSPPTTLFGALLDRLGLPGRLLKIAAAIAVLGVWLAAIFGWL